MLTVHTRAEIERRLRARLVPQTDNREALLELGFTPAYPHLAADPYYGSMWMRATDARADSPAAGNARALVVERAIHVAAPVRRRRLRLQRPGLAPCAARHRRYRSFAIDRIAGIRILHADPA